MSCLGLRIRLRTLNTLTFIPKHEIRKQLQPCYPQIQDTLRRRISSNRLPSQLKPAVKTSSPGKTTAGLLLLTLLGLAVYYDPLALAPTTSASASSSSILNTATFTPYKLISKEQVSPTSSIFILQAPSPSPSTASSLKAQDAETTTLWTQNPGVWSVEIKQPQIMIARAYTPLPPAPHTYTEAMQQDSSAAVPIRTAAIIRLLIRREPHGEVSRFLHALPLGAQVELRGPFTEFKLPERVSAVVFVAGGTGIAPAMQIAHTLAQRQMGGEEEGRTAVQILWANRRREECVGGKKEVDPGAVGAGQSWGGFFSAKDMQSPRVREAVTESGGEKGLLVQQLDSLGDVQEAHDVGVRYFVDEEGSVIRLEDLRKSMDMAVNSTGLGGSSEGKGRKLIVVSGPDGFLEYVCGAKRSRNGVEAQGPVGGLLSLLDLQGWDVWKL